MSDQDLTPEPMPLDAYKTLYRRYNYLAARTTQTKHDVAECRALEWVLYSSGIRLPAVATHQQDVRT